MTLTPVRFPELPVLPAELQRELREWCEGVEQQLNIFRGKIGVGSGARFLTRAETSHTTMLVDRTLTGWSSASTVYVPYGGLPDINYDHPGGLLLAHVRFSWFDSAIEAAQVRLRVGSEVSRDIQLHINVVGNHTNASFWHLFDLVAGRYPVWMDMRGAGAGNFQADVNDYIQIVLQPLGVSS